MIEHSSTTKAKAESKTLLGRFSLLQQWATATILSVLPLFLAVSYAAISLQQQNSSQRELVKRIDLVNANSGAVAEYVKEMVRLSRQYLLLQEPSFLKLYQQKSQAMEASIDSLRPFLVERDSQPIMDAMLVTARDIGEELRMNSNVEQITLSAPLQLLVSLSEELSDQVETYRRLSLRKGEQEFKRIVNQLFILTVLAFPGTLALMVMGTYMVSRPLWRLSQAIQSLAEQNWENPISIEGPSDLAALGRNLEWMRKQVIASDRQTTAFIQHVTHELKTPIAAIIEAGNLLDEEVSGPLTSRQRSILTVLKTNARNLEHLIGQLLNYNAVSHGIFTQSNNVDIYSLCESTCSRLEASQPDKNVQWVFRGNPRTIRSDPLLLEMILRNLLDNAFQFISCGGKVMVEWHVAGSEWILSISDNGPGIDPNDMENIYKPFFSGAKDLHRKGPKTGMGLSIVLECVHLLNGRIEVSSRPGEGAEFTIHFPLSAR